MSKDETDYSDVSLTAESLPELHNLLQGLFARYPQLNPDRLHLTRTDDLRYVVTVADEVTQ